MISFINSLCSNVFGLVASYMPAPRSIVEEVASYYTVIPGTDFDVGIVLTKVPKENPVFDLGLATGVTAAIVSCCVAAASVGLFAYKKYGDLKKLYDRTECDLGKQKDDAEAENRKLNDMLDEKDRMLQELSDQYEEEFRKMADTINELEIENQNMDDELESALRLEKEAEALLEDGIARELEMEELLLLKDRQIDDLLSEGRRLKFERQQLTKMIEKDHMQKKSLLAELKEAQMEMEHCINIIEERENNLRVYYEGEIQKKDEMIESLHEKLEVALQREKEMESLLVEAKGNERKVILFREQLENRNDELKEEVLSLKKRESEHQQDLQKLREECKMWEDKCKIQEEDRLKEQKRAREQQRMKEETLRNEDKYMLMELLHGIAERNFHLEHIALEHGNEHQQNITEEEQGKEKDKDLLDYMLNRKAEQYQRAQQERTNYYSRQWGDLTQMLQDLDICGVENLSELRNATSGQNSENLGGTLQKEFDEVSRQLHEATDKLQEAEEKAQEVEAKLREAEHRLIQKETLDRRAALKSEADRCVADQDFDSALALLRIIVKQYGNELECRVKEVRCLLALARTEEAQEVLDELPKEFKETHVMKIESALLSACNLEFCKSRMLLSEVLEVCPNHPRALIAQRFVQQRMLWEALPGIVDAKDFETALENIALATSLGCLYPWVSVDLARIKGNILCSLGRLMEACECFLSVLAVDEDEEDCRLRLGLCFLLLGRHRDAISEFTRLEEEAEKGEYLISLAEDLERMQPYGCPYKVLGVETHVGQDEIRKAYRRSALKYHPDKHKDDDKDCAHSMMLQINYANDLLSNKKKKNKYDNTRQAAEEYAAEVFGNANLPEWLDDEEDDESESDSDCEYNSDSDEESESNDESESDSEDDSESDSEDDSDVELMECSHSDYLDNYKDDEDDEDEELEDEEDDGDEELEDEEDDGDEELEDEEDDDEELDEEVNDDDTWEDISSEEYLEESDEDFDAMSDEESKDECDNDSVVESDDDSDDESNEGA
ncbi:A-kinase anchor protein 9-like [Macrobrachium nipponense]|uniref:A-kinase anchor protein 9-like n=1 Tax=Macrobrachium nipponense TaxID=159736 RepID=UPI0030C7D5DA